MCFYPDMAEATWMKVVARDRSGQFTTQAEASLTQLRRNRGQRRTGDGRDSEHHTPQCFWMHLASVVDPPSGFPEVTIFQPSHPRLVPTKP